MKWMGYVVIGLAVLAAIVAGVGSTLPRNHQASRTLRVKASPAEVWPLLLRATQATGVPVNILENQPPIVSSRG